MSQSPSQAARFILDATKPRLGRAPFILGLAGAQGSGKSTIARALVAALGAEGRRAAALSLDDFYFPKDVRRRMAQDIHPLFETRGVPGTHDVELAICVLDRVRAGEGAVAPFFDKGLDDRRPTSISMSPNLEILVFEGWCLGARPDEVRALSEPVNALERDRDASGAWRRAVNDALAGAYQRLFSRIDFLAFLRAPDFDVVRDWRLEQESALAGRGASAPATMNKAEISVFVEHFERITRAMLADAPSRADLTIDLDRARRVTAVRRRA